MLVLKGATIINFYPSSVIPDQDIIIEDGKIINIGRGIADEVCKAELRSASTPSNIYTDKETAESPKTIKVMDLKNKYVSPGLVCSHNHFYSALARGITANIKPSHDFIEVLKHLWWKLDRALDQETLYFSGIIGALEAIKCGTTTVIDHNASPYFIKGSLSLLNECFEKAGLRGILGYEITNRNGKKGAEAGINETQDFISSLCRPADGSLPLVEASVGAHASFTLDDSVLNGIAGIINATGRGIHIHVGEDSYDTSFTHHIAGKDILERLEDFGIINNKSIFAHGVNISSKDIELLNKYDSFLIHNPRSNMNNHVGYMDQLNSINNVALGTDGIGSDMLEEIKFGYFKNRDADGKFFPGDFARMLQNGNRLLERYFNAEFGSISKGYAADLTIYDYKSPTPLNEDNLGGHLIFGLSSKDVVSVIINGKVAYENRTFPFDVESIYENAVKASVRLWSKMDLIAD